ncbi:MAG: DUF1223 domain-containing protein [Alphaproteobacteria bacterium]|nr:DUF1223 domain-containing protein [Alphaproteobacteria bacterium]
MVKLLVAALAAVTIATSAAAESAPTVVELFTSQGCSSCPPADAVLAYLAARADVIALSFHVDYWDYLGWWDTFSSAWATERQKLYARALGTVSVYTPQIVIGGGGTRGWLAPRRRPGRHRRGGRAPAEPAGQRGGGGWWRCRPCGRCGCRHGGRQSRGLARPFRGARERSRCRRGERGPHIDLPSRRAGHPAHRLVQRRGRRVPPRRVDNRRR